MIQKDLFNDYSNISPPLRYPGSKYRAAKYIIPYFPKIIDEYREPFFGSGAIFFTLPKVSESWINDIDQDLMITYKIMSEFDLREKLISMIKQINPTRDFFEKVKLMKPQNDLEIAYKYFVINRMAYSGIMKQPNFGFHPIKSVQPDKWPSRIREAGEKLKNVKMTSLHYRELLLAEPVNKNLFIFLDPPYFSADQKRAYLHSFTEMDHIELLELLKAAKYKFCLTYDNCDKIKSMYSWANIHEKNWMYHTANSKKTTRKIGKELIITNY